MRPPGFGLSNGRRLVASGSAIGVATNVLRLQLFRDARLRGGSSSVAFLGKPSADCTQDTDIVGFSGT